MSLMAKFRGIFCRPFLLSVLIIEGVGGMEGGVGWGGVGWDGEGWVGGEGGRWQKPPLGTLYEQP